MEFAVESEDSVGIMGKKRGLDFEVYFLFFV